MDYLRFTGPSSSLDQCKTILRDFFGELVEGKPTRFYPKSLKVGSSSGVFWGSSQENLKDRLKVELSGAMLDDLELAAVIQLMRLFTDAGLSATRIDVAVDLFNQPKLIDRIYEGVLRKELVGAKTHRLHVGGDADKRNNHGIEIGRRGKDGSGRYLRVYDKGLETGTQPQGKWVRWEVEFSSSNAATLVYSLLQLEDVEEVAERLLEYAFGAVDFREPGDRHIKRRKRMQWFQALVGQVKPVMLRIARHRSDLAGYKAWVSVAVLPKLEKYACELGISLQVLLEYLGEGRKSASPTVLNEDTFRQLECEYKKLYT